MKFILSIAVCAAVITNTEIASVPSTKTNIVHKVEAKYDIKIKNDSGDEVTVYNAGSGGTYRLQKNVITTIKMEEGDKLYIYEGGKKGRLLLTASAEMDGRVQMFSKL